jgi:hypothetical protein
VRSGTSRELIRTTAHGAAAALVLESPLPGGALKTARKGTATGWRQAGGARLRRQVMSDSVIVL